jgi:hypothetical protein
LRSTWLSVSHLLAPEQQMFSADERFQKLHGVKKRSFRRGNETTRR